jgi:hypothetical protein
VTAYLAIAIKMHEASFPYVPVAIHVDDLSAQAKGTTPQAAADKLQAAAAALAFEIQDELQLPLEPHKAFALGSNEAAVTAITRALGFLAGSPATTVKKLGCEYSRTTRLSYSTQEEAAPSHAAE